MSESLPQTIGGYLIDGRVGGGGMANVFRARPPDEFREAIGRDYVAIKTLLPTYAREAQFREMFAEEAEISTSLQHANVVELIDFGETSDGTLFLVMEWVDGLDLGQTLRSFRRRKLRMHPVASAAIVERALRGLHAAHTRIDREGNLRAVVHRDVSPANILLSSRGEVKIADFGLARPLDRVRRTLPGIVKGKFAYLAPEQAFDRAVDPRTDVFAAGIVLWEALASRHLFRRDDDIETVLLVRQAHVPDVRRYAPGVDDALVAILGRALQADPDHRYDTADAFAEALSAWLATQPYDKGKALVSSVVRDVLAAEKPMHAAPRTSTRRHRRLSLSRVDTDGATGPRIEAMHTEPVPSDVSSPSQMSEPVLLTRRRAPPQRDAS